MPWRVTTLVTLTDASIPVVHLPQLRGLQPDSDAIATLGEALSSLGFVAVVDHGVDAALLQRAYATAADTFALPAATKQGYERPEEGRQRGYTSMGIEHAKDRDTPDLKEFWQVGRSGPGLPDNVFATEVEGFEATMLALFHALDSVAAALLGGIERYLQLPVGFFEDFTRGGNSVMRIIHYPPLRGDVPEGAVRAAAHEDINLLTVLPVSTQPGLQLMTRAGEWVDVQTPPDVMVCDTGDMMQLLTGGRLRSTTHRVVNPTEGADRSRYSMPFFCHPRPDAELSPARDGAPAILAHDFMMERLRAIGVA